MRYAQTRPTSDRHQNGTRDFYTCLVLDTYARADTMAARAQLGERQTEHLKVTDSIPGLGT